MPVRSKHDHVRTRFLDVVEQRMKRAALGDLTERIDMIGFYGAQKMFKLGGRAPLGLFLIGVKCGEFIRGEPVCGITRLRFDNMKQVQLSPEGLCELTSHLQNARRGVRKIHCYDDCFHGTSNEARARLECKQSLVLALMTKP